jgi:hypothetical protein
MKYIEYLFAIHAIASVICAMTPTKKDDQFLGKAYKALEILALNIGKAKQ